MLVFEYAQSNCSFHAGCRKVSQYDCAVYNADVKVLGTEKALHAYGFNAASPQNQIMKRSFRQSPTPARGCP